MVSDKETLSAICDLFGIGSAARTPHVILENVRNALRRERCLRAIERRFFAFPTPPGEWGGAGEECLLNWGDDPLEYQEKFLDALPRVAAAHGVPAPASTQAAPASDGVNTSSEGQQQ